MHELYNFFHPKSVAVIGASPKEGKVGYSLIKNIISSFKGKVYAVNPNEKEVLGHITYKSVLDIKDEVSLAVIAVKANIVPTIIEECGKKNIKACIIISSGFSESGNKELEKNIISIASNYGNRILGPNSLGLIAPYSSLNASFTRTMPMKGPIGFISQSGAFCTSAIEYSIEEKFGFSGFVSIGNKADIEDGDLIKYFSDDEKTKCIAIYMENAKNGRKFFDALKKCAKKKPIVILKSGRSEAGAKAASSHTGAIAGSDKAYDAAFKQAGVYRAKTMFELFDSARALAYQPPLIGEGIAILTNAGGPGVIAADTAYELALPLSKISDKTLKEIDKVCPPTWNRGNPLDIIGDANVERYYSVLKILANAEEVHGIIVLVGPQ
ncbi:MAG: CoA-binding protein, partial [Candidatus Thermoplasmatota archaeon]